MESRSLGALWVLLIHYSDSGQFSSNLRGRTQTTNQPCWPVICTGTDISSSKNKCVSKVLPVWQVSWSRRLSVCTMHIDNSPIFRMYRYQGMASVCEVMMLKVNTIVTSHFCFLEIHEFHGVKKNENKKDAQLNPASGMKAYNNGVRLWHLVLMVLLWWFIHIFSLK